MEHVTNPLAGLFKARQREAPGPGPYARSLRLCGEHLAAQEPGAAGAARATGATGPQVRPTRAIGAFAASGKTPERD